MKSTLMIKDLSATKELDGKAMSLVRGGSNVNTNYSSIGDFKLYGDQRGFGNAIVGVSAPTVMQSNSNKEYTNLTNVFGKMNAEIY
jgi:hypothetical protein